MRIFRFKIRTLIIIVAAAACLIAYYGQVWRQLNAEQKSLKQLESAGALIGPSYQEIPSWFDDQGLVRKWINWPVHAIFGKKELVTRNVSIEFTVPGYHTSFDNFAEDIGLLANCKYLEKLTLRCKVTPKELDAFRDLKHLNFLDLSATNADDKHVDAVLKIPNLEQVNFGKKRLSVGAFERLDDAGINVQHAGLKDYCPRANFLSVNELHYKINTSQSSLSAEISFNDKSKVTYELKIEVLDSRYHADRPVIDVSRSCEFQAAGNWRNLSGPQSLGPPSKNMMRSRHYVVAKNITILARNKNVFHVRCQVFEPDGKLGLIDVKVPFLGVSFQELYTPYTLERTKHAMSTHYDLEDFGPPKIDVNSQYPISYSLKPESMLTFNDGK